MSNGHPNRLIVFGVRIRYSSRPTPFAITSECQKQNQMSVQKSIFPRATPLAGTTSSNVAKRATGPRTPVFRAHMMADVVTAIIINLSVPEKAG